MPKVTIPPPESLFVLSRRRAGRLWTQLKQPEWLFLSVALIFSLIMLFLLPPFMAPDEHTHFFRAYQISQGQIVSINEGSTTGGLLPTDLINQTMQYVTPAVTAGKSHVARWTYFVHTINMKKKSYVAFNNTAVYSPVAYIPQVIGVTIARLIHPSTLFMMYAGRFCNLIAFLAMMVLAIRLLPFGKWVLVVVGLFPMTIQQGASLSSDVMTTGTAFISIALFLRLWYSSDRMLNRRLWLLIVALGVLLGLTKQSNVILIAPFLILPARFFAHTRQRVFFLVSLLGATGLAAFAWYAVIKLRHYNLSLFTVLPGYNQLQAQTITRHPFLYSKDLFHTYFYDSTQGSGNVGAALISPNFYWQSFFGVFSRISYQMPLSAVILGYGTLVMALLIDPGRMFVHKITPLFRTYFVAIILASVLLVSTLIFLVWTPPSVHVIEGVQGRYFIPFTPLLIPLFANQSIFIRLRNKWIASVIFGSTACVNLAVMVLLTVRYFY